MKEDRGVLAREVKNGSVVHIGPFGLYTLDLAFETAVRDGWRFIDTSSATMSP